MKDAKDFNLLIVDDEQGLRDALQAHFELDDYNVFVSENGQKALEIIQSQPIDFVISDVRMPELDGVALLEQIKSNYPEGPAIVLASGFAEITREEVIKKGALDLLKKPIDMDQLEKYITEHRSSGV